MASVQHEIFKLKGIVSDIEPAELMNGAPPVPGLQTNNVWTGGSNVHFDKSSTRRVSGYAKFAGIGYPAGAVPVYAFNVITPQTSYWVWVDEQGTDAVVMVTDGNQHWDISKALSKAAGRWTSTILNGVPILNNGIDAPVWWDGDVNTPIEDIPDWPADTTCGSIRAFQFHLIAMDISTASVSQPNRVMWSDAADTGTIPQEWTPSASNDAGDTQLGDTSGRVIDGAKLRDLFIIYKQHATIICQYVAGQFVFNFLPLFNTSGVQSVNCVIELRGKHWVFADDDIIVHDGNSYKSIVDNKVRDLVFKVIDIQKNYLCTVAVDLPNDEIWFAFPPVGQTYCTVGLIYSFSDDAWGVRELPNVTSITGGIMPFITPDLTWDNSAKSWKDDPRIWNEAEYSETANGLVMSAPIDGHMYEVNASHSNDGVPIEAYVERLAWVLGGEQGMWSNVLVQAIYPHITGSPGDVVRVHISATMTPDEPVSWQSVEDYIIPSGGFDDIKIDCLAYGRYLNVRFSSTGGSPWQLHRIGAQYVVESKF